MDMPMDQDTHNQIDEEQELEEGEEIVEDPEPPLDPEVAARRAAALQQVRKFGDPILKTKARPITVFDDTLRNEIAWMARIMNDAIGVGLAATQVGALRRL